MAHHHHYIKPETAPVKELARLLDHLWADELTDYAADPSPRHVFHHLVAVANWLNAGTTWTAEQYVAAWEASPESKWLAARSDNAASKTDDTATANTPSEPPHWEYEGYGSRYRVRGKKPSVTVVVGWDRPLHTFFAQVWDVPEGAEHHEEGKLLYWAGCGWNDVPTLDHLVEQLAPHVHLPDDLLYRLEADKLPEAIKTHF